MSVTRNEVPPTEEILENVVRLVGVFEKASLQDMDNLPILELAKWVIFVQPDSYTTENT